MKARLLSIEGTDCSGKGTQTKMLVDHLILDQKSVATLDFPDYETPTGKIVGGPYLGKEHISPGLFPEGAANVDPKVASLYYAADRRYNKYRIEDAIKSGKIVILNRYTGSNMGHQGGKLHTKEERLNMYKWLETLEYDLLELPRPDITIFLYMPYQYALALKENRPEKPDQHEASEEHLRNAEAAYLELAELFNFKRIDCVKDGKVRTVEDIHEEIYQYISSLI